MRKSICVVCKREKKGKKIEDDLYIEAIRKIKSKLNISQNNILVVCKECLPKAEEKRRRFEMSLMTWGVLATLMFVAFIILSPTLYSFALGILTAIFFMLLALSSYFPKVEKHGKER